MVPRSSRPRRGMALAVVLIFLFVLTAALAAGFAVNVGERRLNDAGLQAANVIALAEAGLQRALADRAGLGFTSIPPAAAESARVVMSGGTVDIIVTQLRPALSGQPALYLIRAHAFRRGATAGGESLAEQTVTQLATWQTGTMKVQAGWTSLSGIDKNGTSGVMSGVDGCGDSTTKPAVSVPTVPGYTGPTAPLSGGPPLVDNSLGATSADMANSVPIDWPGIVAGTVLPADYTVPPDAFPSSTQFADTNFWPIIKIDNLGPGPLYTYGPTYSIPRRGRGILIVEGHTEISGSDMWSGVVLVGGNLTSDGNNTIAGAIVTGLNVKLGLVVPPNSIGNGNKYFQYNSCSVAQAVANSGKLRSFTNTWSTMWPTY